MISDLPRVEYGSDKITQEDIKEAREKNAKLQERLKQGKEIGASLSNQIGTENFLRSKIKGENISSLLFICSAFLIHLVFPFVFSRCFLSEWMYLQVP